MDASTLSVRQGLWVIRVSQLLGYFPMSIRKRSQSSFLYLAGDFLSWPVFISIALIGLCLIVSIASLLNTNYAINYIQYCEATSEGPTYVTIYMSWLLCQGFFQCYIRLLIIIRREEFLEFWPAFTREVDDNLSQIPKDATSRYKTAIMSNFAFLLYSIGTNMYYHIPGECFHPAIKFINITATAFTAFHSFSLLMPNSLIESLNLIINGLVLELGKLEMTSSSMPLKFQISSFRILLDRFEKCEELVGTFNVLFHTRILLEILYFLLLEAFIVYFIVVNWSYLAFIMMSLSCTLAVTVAYSVYRLCDSTTKLTEGSKLFTKLLAKQSALLYMDEVCDNFQTFNHMISYEIH
jgi:hypothetical protein